MTATDSAAQYRTAWQVFVDQTRTAFDGFAAAAADDPGDLHELLTSIHPVAYDELHRLVGGGDPASSNNIGSATGLFFEQAVAEIITGYFRRRIGGARVERNTCSDHKLADVARDPDLLISVGGRHAIFEVKVAPKKKDILRVCRHREEYERLGVKYYLVGGYASLAQAELRSLASDGSKWVCLVTGSKRNLHLIGQLPRLDALLADAQTFLAAT